MKSNYAAINIRNISLISYTVNLSLIIFLNKVRSFRTFCNFSLISDVNVLGDSREFKVNSCEQTLSTKNRKAQTEETLRW